MSFAVSEEQNCYKRPVIDLGKEADKEFTYNRQILGKAKIEFCSQDIIQNSFRLPHGIYRTGHVGDLVKGSVLFVPYTISFHQPLCPAG